MFEISLREIRPCLRNARIISTSAEFTKMGAFSLDIFFALVTFLADKVHTIESKRILRIERIAGFFHYSHLDL
jgi:hypothetical protein